MSARGRGAVPARGAERAGRFGRAAAHLGDGVGVLDAHALPQGRQALAREAVDGDGEERGGQSEAHRG